MNEKVQETINAILSEKMDFPEKFGGETEDKDKIISTHSLIEWAYIYKECVLRSKFMFWGDLRYIIDGVDLDSCYYVEGKKKGYFPYIPFDPQGFCEIIAKLVKKFNIKSMLDVGAGYGDKVILAKEFVEKADGIEYLDSYIEKSKLFGLNLIHGDAFEFDKYNEYDLLYLYHPISEPESYINLVNVLFEKMRPKSFLVEVYDPYEELLNTYRDRKEELNLRKLREKMGRLETVIYKVK
ncbi:MAG TPA: hypothetical protein VJ583_03480 [Nitrososphaeraceae archaeon]|nr:hypothetical protein [Nitrososphaeraceae archaeon]